MKSYPNDLPVYSHNPNHNTSFPLLVLDVRRKVCNPRNEGFCMVHWHEELQFVYVKKRNRTIPALGKRTGTF